MKSKVWIASVISLSVLTACTEPHETTAVGAAAGGALGAGLGAIIGNQTGSAGGGLAIGALAGAAAGAAVGNALEAQQQAIRTQDEAIERQERVIQAQRAELGEYRRGGPVTDSGSSMQREYLEPERAAALRFQARPSQPMSSQQMSPQQTPSQHATASQQLAANTTSSVREQDMTPVQQDAPRAALGWRPSTSKAATTDAASLNAAAGDDACGTAQTEVTQAAATRENSEKLFHYRRALRLCPEQAALHNGLGEVYLSLNRTSDAEFEFKEALRLDPGLDAAQANLKRVGKSTHDNQY